jgi:hypothetical protein
MGKGKEKKAEAAADKDKVAGAVTVVTVTGSEPATRVKNSRVIPRSGHVIQAKF